MLWNVWVIVDGEPVYLGRVRGDHGPAALGNAWKKWPKRKDPKQTQYGFSIRSVKSGQLLSDIKKKAR